MLSWRWRIRGRRREPKFAQTTLQTESGTQPVLSLRRSILRPLSVLRCIPHSHARRGNAVFDAPRRLPWPRLERWGEVASGLVSPPFPHFLTCTVIGWLPVFTRPETVPTLLDSWQFLQDQDRLTLLGYVELENHVHFIASAENLPKEVGDFKSYTARQIALAPFQCQKPCENRGVGSRGYRLESGEGRRRGASRTAFPRRV